MSRRQRAARHVGGFFVAFVDVSCDEGGARRAPPPRSISPNPALLALGTSHAVAAMFCGAHGLCWWLMRDGVTCADHARTAAQSVPDAQLLEATMRWAER